VAALGGMLVPAGFFVLLNHDTDTLRGWGIPMATDIAFAIGILVLLGNRVPRNLIIFLTALAIADDLGAVLVIALFYTQELRLDALFAAGTISALLFLLNRGGIRAPLPYWLLGTLLWLAFLASGIHATIAGVVLAFMIPARPKYTAHEFDTRLEELRDAMREESLNDSLSDAFSDHRLTAIAESAEQASTRVQSPLQRIEHGLNPWVTYLVIPIFALSNAGIDFAEFDLGGAFASPLTQGILLGLVLGKFLGITLFSYAAVTLGLGRLPTGVSWMQLAGAGWLGGIGFTMSLFIGQLAFDDPQAINLVKLGVLAASVISAVIGVAWLLWASKGRAPG
jgi:NhaA family Na+:H+ antiporter